jgi:hypothetical protein
MEPKDNNQFVYKDSNVMRWAGVLFLVLSPLFFLLFKKDSFSAIGDWTFVLERLGAWIFVAISLIMVLFSSNLTISADKSTRMLRLRYGSVFRRTKDVPFEDIADIQVQTSVFTSRARRIGYRLVAVLKNGTMLPFRSYFTRHDNKKQAAVDLRFAVIGSRHSEVPKVKSAGASLTI